MAVIVLPSPAPGLDTATHLQAGRLVELLDDVAERPVLLGLEGGGRHEAHEMLVHVRRRRLGEPAGRSARDALVILGAGYRLGRRARADAARWLRRRPPVPEGPVPLGLLERLEELAHSGSRARAERARSESEEAQQVDGPPGHARMRRGEDSEPGCRRRMPPARPSEAGVMRHRAEQSVPTSAAVALRPPGTGWPPPRSRGSMRRIWSA